jgi:hypothetical protein
LDDQAGDVSDGLGDSAVGADAVDGIGAALDSRLAELEKSAQHGRLAQQH